MSKYRFWLIVLVVGLLAVFSIGGTGGPPELKIQKALGVTEGSDVHSIPVSGLLLPTCLMGPRQ